MRTNLEAILNHETSRGWNSEDLLRTLTSYLTNGGERLSLEQYFSVRQLIDSRYRREIQDGILHRDIAREYAQEVGFLFTDYIRREHYRLLDEKRGFSYKPQPIEKPKLKDRIFSGLRAIKDRFCYNQKKADNHIYTFESMVWDKGQIDRNGICNELIKSIPRYGLSVYTRETLERAAYHLSGKVRDKLLWIVQK